MSLNFYLKNLQTALSECSNERDGFLESIFYRRTASIRPRKFMAYPVFTGIAGTSGQKTENRYYYLRLLMSYLGLLFLGK